VQLAERLAEVRAGISEASRLAGRDESEISTIVVTKFHPASLVRELHGLGVRTFGESRDQEASEKALELADLDLEWHFVGQVQSKKAKSIRRYARVIHSLDRPRLVPLLDEPGEPVNVFVQVNLSDNPERGGVDEAALEPLVDAVLAARGIRLLGLMCVAPLGLPSRPAFARLRELSDVVRASAPDAAFLSMGMSGDYRDAIAEGATHLRIGAAITGNRPERG
jgi:pyridoxal phosphate enzyme (YggS family)